MAKRTKAKKHAEVAPAPSPPSPPQPPPGQEDLPDEPLQIVFREDLISQPPNQPPPSDSKES